MSNFGTRQDPDPTPYGEKYPCFCLHKGQLELLASPNHNDPTRISWAIVVSDQVICTHSNVTVKGGAWDLSNWGAIFPSISWTFYKTCGNCKKETCGGFHDLDDFHLSGDDPIGSAPAAVQKLLDFVKPEFERIPNISLIESIILLSSIQGEFLNASVYGDPSLPKDPTTKTCAEVSQWCKGTSPFP